MKIKEITICGIRGFNLPQTIQFNGKLVLIFGHNGAGKSSVVEAMEWLLYNEIARKELSDCKSEYSENYLENVHYSNKSPPYVEATFIENGKLLTLKREYVSSTISRTFVNGKKCNFDTLGSLSELSCKPILSQVEVKRFVESQRKDRWNEISRIIGLEILGRFRDEILELIKTKQNDSLFVKAKGFASEIEDELGEFKELKNVISSMSKRPYDERMTIQFVANSLGIRDPKLFTSESLKKEIKLRMTKIIQPENIAILDIPIDFFSERVLNEALQYMDDILKLFDKKVFVKEELVEFLSIGLNLIEDEICPFCKQKTLTKEVLGEIKRFVKMNNEKLEIEKQLKQKLVDQDTAFSSVRFVLNEFTRIKSQLPNIVRNLEKIDQYAEESLSLSDILKTDYKELEKTINAFQPLLDEYLTICQRFFLRDIEYDSNKLGKLKEDTSELLANIRSLVSKMTSKMARIRETILLKTPNIDENMVSLRKFLCLEKLLTKINLIKTLSIFEERCILLTKLCGDLEKFEKTKAEHLLQKLSKDVETYFNKLNPREKVKFSKIVPSSGKSRWVLVKGESHGKEINPISCFSESHLNCLGLSLYFTQRVDRNPFWDLLILDDPVQSMDDNHSSNLVDIIAEIRKIKKKQVIILTHEKQFLDVIKNKFYYDEHLYYHFSEGDKDGPKIELIRGTLESYLMRAQKLASGNQDDINDAGVNLRKAIENFCYTLLVIKHGRGAKAIQKLELDDLF